MTESQDGCSGRYYIACMQWLSTPSLVSSSHVTYNHHTHLALLLLYTYYVVSSVGCVNMQENKKQDLVYNPSLYWAYPHPLMMLQLAIQYTNHTCIFSTCTHTHTHVHNVHLSYPHHLSNLLGHNALAIRTCRPQLISCCSLSSSRIIIKYYYYSSNIWNDNRNKR